MCGFREDNRGHHHCYGLFPAPTTSLLLSLPLSLTATYEFAVETPFNILAEFPLGSREGAFAIVAKLMPSSACLPLCVLVYLCTACVCVCVP